LKCVGRANIQITGLHGNARTVPISDPIATAVGVLWTANMQPSGLLDSFLEAGGIPAVVRLLRKSTCPTVLVVTTGLIGSLINSEEYWDGRPGRSPADLADMFHQAGEH
jgi:hypothetical protein